MDERDSVGVAIRSISKRYGSTVALKDITLNIEPGEFVSLLGPSGSGKTTLLGALGGFVMPSSGSVWVGDQDMTYMPPHKRNIGIVFQSYALFPHMSVGENVAFPLRARRLPKSTWPERVRQALAWWNWMAIRIGVYHNFQAANGSGSLLPEQSCSSHG